MEFKYQIVPADRLVRIHCWGLLTVDEIIRAMNTISAAGDLRPDWPVLADLREAYGDWDYSESQRLRDYLVRAAHGLGDVRWAALCSPGPLQALSHVVILITEAIESEVRIRLFEEQAAALRWLREK